MIVSAYFLELLTVEPVLYISIVLAVVISISLHELGHGIAATWQGDDTPRRLGHMTLDPRKHMPTFSWVLLLLVGISYGLMPVNPRNFRSKYGDAMVAFAGPAVNFILALVGLTVWILWLKFGGYVVPGSTAGNFQRFFQLFATLNIVLGTLNLLPLPPLDGSAVLGNFSPAFKRVANDPSKRQVFMVAFMVLFFFSGYLWDFADWVSATARAVAHV